MKLKDKLKNCQKEGSALLATNFYNFETCCGIIQAASGLDQSLILQLTKSSIDYMGLKTAVKIASTVSENYDVKSWLHLDHCKSIELIKKCLDEGFDSVMIDASDKAFNENVSISRDVVKLAEAYNANVEAELGYVPKPEQEVDNEMFTDPKLAEKFVSETGVNALAVAIGSKHGFYKGEPKLDFNRLKEIRNVTNACLVLHGGSGIASDSIREAINIGITKVNVATETKDTFMRALKEILIDSDEIDLRKVFPEAINEVKTLIISKLNMVSMNS